MLVATHWITGLALAAGAHQAAPQPAVPIADGARAAPGARVDHVVLVSVDGLRSDALIAVPADQLPGFTRLEQGAYTLNARCDPDRSVTLPNHTAMVTGRPVLGAHGHAWLKNDDADEGETLHSNRGAYVASMFDVAHDRGVRTATFAGKSKFAIYDVSFDAEHGAADEVAPDNGRDKLDEFVFAKKTPEIVDHVLRVLKDGGPRALVFAHFAVTDLTAHVNGWDVTPNSKYMRAVESVDAELVRLLDAIEGDAKLARTTAIVLTADHGGGAPLRSHDQAHMWVDYIIPFVVWTGASTAEPGHGVEHDLYALNAGVRLDPGLKQPPMSAPGLPPIRNGDSGNLALALLGLPAIPGSTINGAQDLRAR